MRHCGRAVLNIIYSIITESVTESLEEAKSDGSAELGGGLYRGGILAAPNIEIAYTQTY